MSVEEDGAGAAGADGARSAGADGARSGGDDGARSADDGARSASIPGPFARLSPPRMKRLLLISGALAAALFLSMGVVDEQMKENGGPGIVGMEVAGTAGRAAEILAQWGEGGRDAARVSLLLDFPFMIAYAIFFGAACTAVGRGLARVAAAEGTRASVAQPLARLAPWLGWAFVLAAVLDLIENVSLLRVIEFDLTPWAGIAQAAAAPKFAIFGAGIAFLLVSLLLTVRPRRASADAADAR